MDGDQLTDDATCDRAQALRDQAAAQLVRDVMVKRPKTLPADATVGDVRDFFANPKVITVLLADGSAFAGVLDRGDLPASAPGEASARLYARRDVAVTTPDRPMREALATLEAERSSRLVVLDGDGVTLAGLLCLDRGRAGFCAG